MIEDQSLDFSFSKDCRIHKHATYQLLFRKGRRIALPHFVIYYIENDKQYSRLGCTVSRKVGNAVIRNRCKRQLKEYFRTIRPYLISNIDLSIVARPLSAGLSSLQLRKEITEGLRSFLLVNQR